MSEDRGEKRPRPRGKRPRRKVCDFCVSKIEYIDYKDRAAALHGGIIVQTKKRQIILALFCVWNPTDGRMRGWN